MSQRTRSRTTAAAARKRPLATRQADPIPTAPSAPRGERGPEGEDSSVTPETLARTLRAVAAELERDPALARRVAAAVATGSAASKPATAGEPVPAAHPDAAADVAAPQQLKRRPARAFTPSIITGVSPDLGPGIPDPFALARRLGPDGLRTALADLRRGTLRAMIREYGIAPVAQVAHITDDAKLRDMILTAVTRKA